jgi:hypothetical protein
MSIEQAAEGVIVGFIISAVVILICRVLQYLGWIL